MHLRKRIQTEIDQRETLLIRAYTAPVSGKESRMGRKIPKKGDIYRHFKGKKYRILDLAVCTETGEDMVVFETVDGSHRMYASFLESFLSALDTGKYPHADQKYRFVLCRNDKQAQASSVKRHGNTTSLILEFLDLDENDQRIAFSAEASGAD